MDANSRFQKMLGWIWNLSLAFAEIAGVTRVDEIVVIQARLWRTSDRLEMVEVKFT
ncbi:hypothetical protein EC9_32210 [Rosistilla ulvae]|uniref:Uncharacterized protein n=1 Tax=Rosistilla ulvae TaxID=1930277 RepID=A0A517M2C2_9BACT|nr:hypothetical protein EC9_32210 [Rosistilla ulvae]